MKKKLEYSNRLEIFKNSLPELSTYEIEKLVEHSMCTNLLNTYDEIVTWAEKIKKQFDTIIRFNNCYKQIEKLLEKYYESSRYFKFERYVDYILSLEKKYNKSNMNWSFPNFTHLKSAPFASNWESEYGWHGYFEDWYIKNK